MSRSGVILPPQDDPDPTDRLPELEIASGDGLGDPLESTGTWTKEGGVAEAVAGERVQELEEQLAGRDTAIADLTTRLTQKTFAITRLEKELAQARAELAPLREAVTGLDLLQQHLHAAEQGRVSLEAERDEQREAIRRLEDQLSEARDNEQRLERKVEDLADQLLEAQEGRSMAEDRLAGSEARLAELEKELADATREAMSEIQRREFDQAREHTASLKRALAAAKDEHAAVEQELHGLKRALERQQAEAGELAQALRERDRRLELLLEQLRNAEARRRIDADMRHADAPRSSPDPQLAIVTERLQEETRLREALERAVAALQAERLQPVPPPLRRRLRRIDPGHEAAFLLLPPRTTIGRTPDNDLQLCESYISRVHAVIKLGADSAIIEDAGSRNGVFVNQRRISRELLHDGDEVVLGKARFRFEAGQA
jgi:chromosome segregation ATPase